MFQQFINACFDHSCLHKYKFNYGDNVFRKHKITETPVPAYLNNYSNWMSYLHDVVAKIGEQNWFEASCDLYGTPCETYCVVHYNGWIDVVVKKKDAAVRLKNTGPSDTSTDIFWAAIVNYATSFDNLREHDQNLHNLKPLFLAAIWFYLCESDEGFKYILFKHTDYRTPFYCGD
jgi:hypothetical protein